MLMKKKIKIENFKPQNDQNYATIKNDNNCTEKKLDRNVLKLFK